MKKKLLVGLLSAVMVLVMMPTAAFAEIGNDNVCKIGDTGYATLADAVKNVKSNETITVLSTIDEDDLTITLPAGVTNVTIAGASMVVVKDLVGTAASNNGLTLKNLEFTQKDHVYTVKGKNVTFEGCKFNAKELSYAGAKSAGIFDGNTTKITTIGEGENIKFKDCDFSGLGSDKELPNAQLMARPYCTNLTLDGCTFKDAFSAVYYGLVTGKFIVKDTTVEVYAYTLHMGGDTQCSMTVSDSTLCGWTSYGSTNASDTVTFNNCVFKKYNNGYDCVAEYLDTTFNECTFDSDFDIYAQTPGKTITLNDCTKDDVLIKKSYDKEVGEVMAEHKFSDSDVWLKSTCIITPIEYGVTFKANGASTTIGVLEGDTVDKTLVKNPTATDKVFAGWLDEDDALFSFDTKITKAITLNAHWIPKSIDDGKVTVKTTDSGISATSSIKKDDVPLTKSEVEQVEAGATVSVDLVVKAVEAKNVTQEEKEEILNSLDDNQKLGLYLDLTMVKKVNGITTEINETLNNIKVTIQIPESLRVKGREYSIIRCHELPNGELEITELPCTQPDGNWQVTFETDKFSTYAIAFEGGTAAVDTSDSSNIMLYVFAGFLALMGIVAISLKRRQETK